MNKVFRIFQNSVDSVFWLVFLVSLSIHTPTINTNIIN